MKPKSTMEMSAARVTRSYFRRHFRMKMEFLDARMSDSEKYSIGLKSILRCIHHYQLLRGRWGLQNGKFEGLETVYASPFKGMETSFYSFFYDYFLTSHEMKTMTHKMDLNHGSLNMNVFYMYIKF